MAIRWASETQCSTLWWNRNAKCNNVTTTKLQNVWLCGFDFSKSIYSMSSSVTGKPDINLFSLKSKHIFILNFHRRSITAIKPQKTQRPRQSTLTTPYLKKSVIRLSPSKPWATRRINFTAPYLKEPVLSWPAHTVHSPGRPQILAPVNPNETISLLKTKSIYVVGTIRCNRSGNVINNNQTSALHNNHQEWCLLTWPKESECVVTLLSVKKTAWWLYWNSKILLPIVHTDLTEP